MEGSVPGTYNAAVDLLDRRVAEGDGERPAIIDDRETVSYAQLADRAARVTALLAALGVRAEERVMLCMHDTADFPAVFLGAIRGGVIPVPVNTVLTADDYGFYLADSRARVLFVSEPLWPTLAAAVARVESPPRVVLVASPVGGAPDDAAPLPRLGALLADQPPAPAAAHTHRDEVAFWLYSSGSTGTPKGTLHLHSHLMATARLYAQPVLGIGRDDVVFSAAKLFFAYGLGNALTFPFSVGATAVLMAERATPAAVMARLRRHPVSIFHGVPTLFASILAGDEMLPDERRPRVCTSAGEALPEHIGQRWQARFGSEILDGIGSTEMLHIFISNRHGQVRYGTSGVPVPGYEVKLVDDSGAPVADGEEGALWVRGPTSAVGYWNRRGRSLDTFHGPWTRTGDRYRRAADGTYTFAGRADDMLKVGGVWVSPFEVESALSTHPAVVEAAVVGRADADGLIKPQAFVVLRPDHAPDDALAQDLKAHVKQRLAPFKYPRWIEFVTELPKTATGKIQRFRLRTPP